MITHTFGYADAQDKAIPNLIHASGDPSEARQEISHWFSDDELYIYQSASERFCQ